MDKKLNKAQSLVWIVNIPLRAVRARYNLPLGGSGFWLDALAAEIIREYDITLTIISCSAAYKKQSSFTEGGITYVQLRTSHLEIIPFLRWRALQRMLSAIQNSHPDFVDFHGSEYGWGEIADKLKIPSVTTLQGVISDFEKYTFGASGKMNFFRHAFLASSSIKQLLRELWALVVLRSRVRAELRQFKVSQYYLGRTSYDQALAYRLQPHLKGYYSAARVLRQSFYSARWNADAHEKQVIFRCGRLAPDKGVELLIRALPLVAAHFPHVHARIGGAKKPSDGWGLELVRLARELGVEQRVEYCGYLDEQNVAAELENCSVFVLPSYNENSPNTLAEAMIMGVPCISAEVGGVSSMVDPGRNGLLFTRGDYNGLANCLIKILSDRVFAEQIARAARETAIKRHDKYTIATTTVEAYNDIFAGEGIRSMFGKRVG